MASTFAQACDALVRERDRVFLERVAADYKIDFKELESKYLESSEAAIKVPKKYKKREPKSVTVTDAEGQVVEKPKKGKAEKQACQGTTAKKEPCKFSALKGECFCKRHLKAAMDAKEAGETPKPVKAPKVPKAPKAPKAVEPMHTHPLDEEPSGPCAPCQAYGNPLKETAAEGMFECEQVSLQSRLDQIMNGASDSESDSEAESDAESEAEVAVEARHESGSESGDLSEEEFEDE